MNEPYRTMLAGLRDHWFLSKYLSDDLDVPDWSGMAADDRMSSLSVGEKVLLDFACAWTNCQTFLDDENRYRVAFGLMAFYGWSHG